MDKLVNLIEKNLYVRTLAIFVSILLLLALVGAFIWLIIKHIIVAVLLLILMGSFALSFSIEEDLKQHPK